MKATNILNFQHIQEFRDWLAANHDQASECWLFAKKGKTKPVNQIWYLDAVEQALCFGWIDTRHQRIDGINMQRFTPRVKKSKWSELNKARCRRLERIGQMTDAGRRVIPDIESKTFKIDDEIMARFLLNPVAWRNFQAFPKLYQRVRIDSIQRDKSKDNAVFLKRLDRLIDQSELNQMFGDWNDYGRLSGELLQET